ncbi:hypothetical protein [Sulfurovum sp.]|uniref:hypothetical protein n=1 Tax=Sulfurovum sp. TaxID=1969726 RepID=UPI002867BB38|nr:hypothetical protein [Sulfurovum sp.]
MYKVQIAHECGCFKKSEYKSEKSFDNQQDAYNYSNIVAEFMNEDFCQKHLFVAQKTVDDHFIITVSNNPNSGSCSTGSCDTDTGATLADSSCDSGSCGCS